MDRFNRHIPAVHPISAAPPKTECTGSPLCRTDFIQHGACTVRRGVSLLFHISHTRKINNQPPRVCPNLRIIGGGDPECLLPCKHDGSPAGCRLTEAEHKVDGRHKVWRKHVKLDADPQDQRNAEYAAEIIPGSFVHQEQYRRRQIGNAVDDQQREARKYEVLKQGIRKREHLKIGQHCVHTKRFTARIDQHADSASDGAEPDEQRPEEQCAMCCAVSRSFSHGSTSRMVSKHTMHIMRYA